MSGGGIFFLGVYVQSKNIFTYFFIYRLFFQGSLGAPPCLPRFSVYNEERIHTKQSAQVHNLLLQFDGQKVAVSFFKNCLLWSSFSLQAGSSLLVTIWIKSRVFSALQLQIATLLSSTSLPYTRFFFCLRYNFIKQPVLLFHSQKDSDVV